MQVKYVKAQKSTHWCGAEKIKIFKEKIIFGGKVNLYYQDLTSCKQDDEKALFVNLSISQVHSHNVFIDMIHVKVKEGLRNFMND
ncbi:hypothetical protein TNCV_1702161 [Trichonephila clavipes]|nr:hypothetical protein TNCV_1702161 [Trichonephila clavipes]